VIERAISTGRSQEADRLMRRAAKEVDERLEAGDRLDPAQVAMITGFALRLAKLLGSSDWVEWSMRVHQSQTLMPSSAVIDRLEELDAHAMPEVPTLIEGFVSFWRDNGQSGPSADLAGLARLEKLMR
jgi:hypothetical protein